MHFRPERRTVPSSTCDTRSALPICRRSCLPRYCITLAAADHLQVGDFCQLGQNVVLYAVGKECVLLFVAKIFKGEYSDASR